MKRGSSMWPQGQLYTHQVQFPYLFSSTSRCRIQYPFPFTQKKVSTLILMSQLFLMIRGSKKVTLIFTNLIKELQKLIRNFYSLQVPPQPRFVFFSHLWCIYLLFLFSLPNFPFLGNALFLSHQSIPFSFQSNVSVTELLPLNFIFTSQWTPQSKGTSV